MSPAFALFERCQFTQQVGACRSAVGGSLGSGQQAETHMRDAEQAVAAKAQRGGEVFSVFGGVAKLERLAAVVRDADDDGVQRRRIRDGRAGRVDKLDEAAAGQVALGVVGDDFDAVLLAGHETRVAGQVELQVEFSGVGISAARSRVGGRFLAVDEHDDAANAAAAVGQRHLEAGRFRIGLDNGDIRVQLRSDERFDIAQRFLAETKVFGEQAGVVVAFLQLLQRDGFVADDPVQALDVAAVGGVVATDGIDHRPGAVGEADQADTIRGPSVHPRCGSCCPRCRSARACRPARTPRTIPNRYAP